eukprot:1910217-Pleurochrysis_carterae.AAC.1
MIFDGSVQMIIKWKGRRWQYCKAKATINVLENVEQKPINRPENVRKLVLEGIEQEVLKNREDQTTSCSGLQIHAVPKRKPQSNIFTKTLENDIENQEGRVCCKRVIKPCKRGAPAERRTPRQSSQQRPARTAVAEDAADSDGRVRACASVCVRVRACACVRVRVRACASVRERVRA